MNTVRVDIGDRAYPIHVGRGLVARAGELIEEQITPTAAVVVTHPALVDRYAAVVAGSLRERGVRTSVVVTPAGERHKKLSTVARLYARMSAESLDRRSLIVTVGGGVIGDVGGFVAATYLRGISFVQIPTTVVAQTDAAIGGKTGVDLATGKNLVGAFHQPRAVIADVEALTSLSVREFRSGLAEVVKYGIICDAGLFGSVVEASAALRRRALASLEPVVLRCCEIKARVVSEDETEQGLRAILNFGHTVGHAVEAATGYRRFRHGEAVAIGMVSACLIGEGIGVTPREVTGSVVDALERFGLPTRFPGSVSSDQVLALLGRDKKALAGIPRFVLARKIGDVVIRGDVPPEAVVAALERQRGIGR